MLAWPLLLLERESSSNWIMRKISIQCHNNPIFFSLRKPPDPVKDIYDVRIYDIKIRVSILMSVDAVSVEYGTFYQQFHLKIWFFWFNTGINFKWYCMLCHMIAIVA